MPKHRHVTLEDSLAPTMPEVFGRIDRVKKQLDQIQRETMRRVDLTPAQYFLLGRLWDTDRQPLKDLAAACGTSRATITGMVDVLERRGLVRRTANPNDRRSLLCGLTKKGRAMRRRAPDVEQLFASCCDGLDGDERRTLAGLLDKLSRSLGGDDNPCDGPCGGKK